MENRKAEREKDKWLVKIINKQRGNSEADLLRKKIQGTGLCFPGIHRKKKEKGWGESKSCSKKAKAAVWKISEKKFDCRIHDGSAKLDTKKLPDVQTRPGVFVD